MAVKLLESLRAVVVIEQRLPPAACAYLPLGGLHYMSKGRLQPRFAWMLHKSRGVSRKYTEVRQLSGTFL